LLRPGAASTLPVERRPRGGLVDQRQDERSDGGSGDYEYDQAHEKLPGGEGAHRGSDRPAPAPAGPSEPDGDMSYDEAHDF
jgi:hypothetical protein